MKLAQMEKARQNKLLGEQKIDELSDYDVSNMKDLLRERSESTSHNLFFSAPSSSKDHKVHRNFAHISLLVEL